MNLLGRSRESIAYSAVAEDIGVCAEPEVEVRQLTASNPFLVVASDGVFEFLTNQEVVNMVRNILLRLSQQPQKPVSGSG